MSATPKFFLVCPQCRHIGIFLPCLHDIICSAFHDRSILSTWGKFNCYRAIHCRTYHLNISQRVSTQKFYISRPNWSQRENKIFCGKICSFGLQKLNASVKNLKYPTAHTCDLAKRTCSYHSPPRRWIGLIYTWHYAVGDCVTILAVYKRMYENDSKIVLNATCME